jgi:hypothetical protein
MAASIKIMVSWDLMPGSLVMSKEPAEEEDSRLF